MFSSFQKPEDRSWIDSATTCCNMHTDLEQSGITGHAVGFTCASVTTMGHTHYLLMSGNSLGLPDMW